MKLKGRSLRSAETEAGFHGRAAPVGSHRLTHAVAASLALGSLSLCLAVALALVSIRLTLALPLAG